MKHNTMTATNGNVPSPHKITPTRGRKPAKRKATAASRPAARGAAKRQANGRSAAGHYGNTTSRLMSRGKQAFGGAYEWAADSAGRALPRAARHLPDQRTLQSVFEDRPILLGVIGLGVGAMIGMMLPRHQKSGYLSLARSRASRKR
jgi:hypothetical protein